MAEKPHMNLVTIGHVDHGKSTLIGRLLFDTGNVPEQEMRKLEEKAKELKKDTFKFAFLMDSVKEERERGVTIDLAHKRFDTDKYYFTLIDAPGHRDFIKNMITGASQADAAILVVAANDGIMTQTKEHVFLSRTLGVNQMVVAVNKMDTIAYDEAKFNKIKEDAVKLLQSVGYKVDEIQFVPVSAWIGDNIAKPSENMAWYKGEPLLKILDTFKVPEKPTDKPLRLPVQDVYTISGIGAVIVGKVETGVLKPGAKIVSMPSGKTGEVKSIEMHHQSMPQALPGDNVGVSIKGLGKTDVKRGDVIGETSNPPTLVEEFTAQIVVLQHPSVITKGYTPVFHVSTAHIACKITEIQKKLDPATGKVLEENPDYIKAGDAAIIKCVPTKPMCIEKNSELPQMARFAIRDMGQTIAAGLCMELVPKKG
ncbi:MAG: translation elongation factor EF-1 subunit alpha [Candidatus Aenigmarchaeota archaeon]|nr:translation elongation factor EF-1 subunit alpha [Candidatus Aenigmarchaeota archaeon]MCK5452167.1 translation elongation factor EF-1 subunit alpha [Candidatus Aenigmarchaeota archaeon]